MLWMIVVFAVICGCIFLDVWVEHRAKTKSRDPNRWLNREDD